MKTFFNLVQEVQKPGLCHHCGGCVTFCTAINYGALEMGEDGKPRYKDIEKCIECGLCYSICPEISELDEETKRQVAWSAPMGRILGTTVSRARHPEVRARATDGGVVTALLLHLFDLGRIDGAIVSRPVGPFQRQPWLATSREEILEAAGFHFDTSHGPSLFSEAYSTFSPSIVELEDVARQRLNRVAFVGTPCQINSLRRMEVLGIVPSGTIKFHLGLFCTGNFHFGPEQRLKLEQIGSFQWDQVRKVNVKEDLYDPPEGWPGAPHSPGSTELYEAVRLPLLRRLRRGVRRPVLRRHRGAGGLDHGDHALAVGPGHHGRRQWGGPGGLRLSG